MDVDKRLLRDADSFAEEVAGFNRGEFIAKVFKTLGIVPERPVSGDASAAGRIQRPAGPRQSLRAGETAGTPRPDVQEEGEATEA